MLEMTPRPAEDETGRLIREAQLGNEDAWRRLHERYRPQVTVVAQAGMPDHLCGLFDPEDVVQSAFFSAFQALPRYEYKGEKAFESWLRAIARNEMISRVRKHDTAKRRPGHDVSEKDPDATINHGEDGDSPSQVYMRRQSRTLVMQAMLCLTHEQQEILWMRNFEQQTWESIAELLQVSVGQIRRRHERALQELIRLLP